MRTPPFYLAHCTAALTSVLPLQVLMAACSGGCQCALQKSLQVPSITRLVPHLKREPSGFTRARLIWMGSTTDVQPRSSAADISKPPVH